MEIAISTDVLQKWKFLLLIIAVDYSSEISGIMEAVHAHLNFKLIALIIALSTVMKNVPHHQVIPVEMYSPSFKRIKGKLHYTKRVG
jgi:hypothetical protein